MIALQKGQCRLQLQDPLRLEGDLRGRAIQDQPVQRDQRP